MMKEPSILCATRESSVEAGQHRDLKQCRLLCSQFKHSLPFSHLVLDDFLDNKFAESLNQEFPAFDPGLASDESEKVGLKCVH